MYDPRHGDARVNRSRGSEPGLGCLLPAIPGRSLTSRDALATPAHVIPKIPSRRPPVRMLNAARYGQAGASLLDAMRVSPDPRTSHLLHITCTEIRKDRYYFRAAGWQQRKANVERALAACVRAEVHPLPPLAPGDDAKRDATFSADGGGGAEVAEVRLRRTEEDKEEEEEEEEGGVSEAALSAHREALLQLRAELATAATALERMEWRTRAAAAKEAHDEGRAAMAAATAAMRGERSAALRERLAARKITAAASTAAKQ